MPRPKRILSDSDPVLLALDTLQSQSRQPSKGNIDNLLYDKGYSSSAIEVALKSAMSSGSVVKEVKGRLHLYRRTSGINEETGGRTPKLRCTRNSLRVSQSFESEGGSIKVEPEEVDLEETVKKRAPAGEDSVQQSRKRMPAEKDPKPRLMDCVVLLENLKVFRCALRSDNKERLKAKVRCGRFLWKLLRKASASATDSTVGVKFTLSEELLRCERGHGAETGRWRPHQYKLNPSTFANAKVGLTAMADNAGAVLLFSPELELVSIEDETRKEFAQFQIQQQVGVFPGVRFAKIDEKDGKQMGFLYSDSDEVMIAIPVVKREEMWYVQKVKNQYQLYNGLPFVGTETFNLPVIVNSSEFQEYVVDDDVITICFDRSKEEGAQNGQVLLKFVSQFKRLTTTLFANKVRNIHLLLDCRMPDDFLEAGELLWYENNILGPIRNHLYSLPIVTAVNGNQLKISEAVFPSPLADKRLEFFDLVAKINPTVCPAKDTIEEWWLFMHMSPKQTFSIHDIHHLANKLTNVQDLFKDVDVGYIGKFIDYLQDTNQTDLLNKYAILPNQKGRLRKKDEIFFDFGIGSALKGIASTLGLIIEEELLHQDLEGRDILVPYDIEERCLKKLDAKISKIPIKHASESEIESIFALTRVFNSSDLDRKVEWTKVSETFFRRTSPPPGSFSTMDVEDTHWNIYASWAEEYLSYLVEKSSVFSAFAAEHFARRETSFVWTWFNDMVNYIMKYSPELASSYAIMPTESGYFKRVSDDIYRQTESLEEIYKDWYRDYVPEAGDPRYQIIDQRIKVDGVEIKCGFSITQKIDGLFKEVGCLEEVRPNGSLHKLFKELDQWYENNEEKGDDMFPWFSFRRPVLIMCAFTSEERNEAARFLRGRRSVPQLQLPACEESLPDLNGITNLDGLVNKFGLNQITSKLRELDDC